MFHEKECELCKHFFIHISPFSWNFDSLQETIDVSSKNRHLEQNYVKYELRKWRSVKCVRPILHTFRFFIFYGHFTAFHDKLVLTLAVLLFDMGRNLSLSMFCEHSLCSCELIETIFKLIHVVLLWSVCALLSSSLTALSVCWSVAYHFYHLCSQSGWQYTWSLNWELKFYLQQHVETFHTPT